MRYASRVGGVATGASVGVYYRRLAPSVGFTDREMGSAESEQR